MSAASAKIMVSAADLSAWIQISGRANFASSVDFKTLVNSLHEDGCRRFALDLTACVLMDSTFLGVLAGFGMRLEEENSDKPEEHAIELLNPNARISELLENLGVSHIFKIVSGPPYSPAAPTVEALSAKATPEELARTSLEAHETLMSLDPENIPRFKDVAQFLAEDLKKHKGNP